MRSEFRYCQGFSPYYYYIVVAFTAEHTVVWCFRLLNYDLVLQNSGYNCHFGWVRWRRSREIGVGPSGWERFEVLCRFHGRVPRRWWRDDNDGDSSGTRGTGCGHQKVSQIRSHATRPKQLPASPRQTRELSKDELALLTFLSSGYQRLTPFKKTMKYLYTIMIVFIKVQVWIFFHFVCNYMLRLLYPLKWARK